MSQRCITCLSPVNDRAGYENSVGETLCDGCFGILWSRKRAEPKPSLAEATMRALHEHRGSLA